uniref:Uncharacterized protein n=1 Tax=Strigops habroptila TaxID=2489341 RepID=A0A672TTB8_STRHB
MGQRNPDSDLIPRSNSVDDTGLLSSPTKPVQIYQFTIKGLFEAALEPPQMRKAMQKHVWCLVRLSPSCFS